MALPHYPALRVAARAGELGVRPLGERLGEALGIKALPDAAASGDVRSGSSEPRHMWNIRKYLWGLRRQGISKGCVVYLACVSTISVALICYDHHLASRAADYRRSPGCTSASPGLGSSGGYGPDDLPPCTFVTRRVVEASYSKSDTDLSLQGPDGNTQSVRVFGSDARDATHPGDVATVEYWRGTATNLSIHGVWYMALSNPTWVKSQTADDLFMQLVATVIGCAIVSQFISTFFSRNRDSD